MSAHSRLTTLCICIAALLVTSEQLQAEKPTDEWLRSTGDDLELCLSGEVFEPGGKPAFGFKIEVQLNSQLKPLTIEPVIDGSRFHAWLPVNRAKPYSLAIRAASEDESQIAFLNANSYELRKMAREGVELNLKVPSKNVAVHVTHQSKPVANATVKAEVGYNNNIHASSDEDGIAVLRLLPNQELDRLTAWTEDHRIGGYSFNRKPVRDPQADSYAIELSTCRELKVRMIDELGDPVPDVEFLLQIATPSPNYNYIGLHDESMLKTDKAGEAVTKWFPDWEKHHVYAELKSPGWILVGDLEIQENVAICNVKRAATRKTITGQVVSSESENAGYLVYFQSFQGERERYSDHLRAFADANGKFTFDVLPDSTYCAFVVDAEMVGKSIDFIAYDSQTDRLAQPELEVSRGQEIELIATTGSNKRPYANLKISLRREHDYKWQEEGETKYGSGGPSWWVTTDSEGRAMTNTLPGTLSVSAYTPAWRTSREVKVVADQPTSINLHRAVVEKRIFTGRLVASDGMEASLAEAMIEVGAIDSEYEDRKSIKTDRDGNFSFEFMAAEIALFAYTADGKASGTLKIHGDHAEPLKIELHPTTEFFGFLTDKENSPQPNTRISTEVRMQGEDNWNSLMTVEFDDDRLTTKSDEFGSYSLTNIPTGVDVMIYAEPKAAGQSKRFVEKIHLKPGL